MTDRREFLAAMAALFAGVVLPEPVREQIVIAPSPLLYQTILEMPPPVGIAWHLESPYIPQSVGPTMYSVMVTAKEMQQIRGEDWGSTQATRALIRQVIARPYDSSKPMWLVHGRP
ncbi:hypothetical protein LCGC14_3072860 [marine sediment metagenome]|uniref:Uncharacterized protein n=1 Tax=marine sediment metagenome TaxID=412755 RepID=A0A0F8WG87_9ZZZZ